MYKIKADFKCGCFKRSAFTKETIFDTKEEALESAKNMLASMNSNFCGTHKFSMSENGNDIIIEAEFN